MGRRGPAPKPTALRLIDGGAGKRPVNTREPVPPAGEPDAPEWLDERARMVWDQLVPRLCAIGLARSIDGGALARYCTHFVLWHQAATFVLKNGQMYPVRAEGRGGKPGRIIGWKEFPANATALKHAQKLLAIEREFGLTPAARTRIRLENEKDAARDTSELKRRMFGA